MKKLFILVCFIAITLSGWAQTSFTLNGFKYTITDSNTVSVISGGTYSGDIIIPSSVIYSNVTYLVTSIGSAAFYDCKSLTSVNIPSSVTSIGKWAFTSCSSLIYVNIPSSVTSIGSGTFDYCRSLTSIIIPSSVTSIESYTFDFCESLTSINIPSSVTFIGDYAFGFCKSLTSVNIPSSVTYIDSCAFYGCTSLTSINIPSSVTSIGSYTFDKCTSLTSINIPSSVTSIGVRAFYGCKFLTSVYIPSSVISIGSCAFLQCSAFITVETDNPNYSSMDGVLYNKEQTTLIQCPISKSGEFNIPSSVTTIGSYAFGDCTSLTSINIPSSVTYIGSNSFYCCISLTSINIPSSVTTIKEKAFYSCVLLKSINIPSSVTSFGTYTFYSCVSLTSIYSYITTPMNLNGFFFFNINKSKCTLYVPVGTSLLYKAATEWSEFNNIVEFEVNGIENVNLQLLKLYPNPATSFINMDLGDLNKVQSLVIFNSLGKKIYESHNSNKQIQLDVSKCPSGLYVIQTVDENNQTNGLGKFTKK